MMRTSYFTIGGQRLHPVWHFVLTIAALGVLGALAVFGLVLFAILLGVGLVAGSVLYLRAWWLGRKLGAEARSGPQTLEGDFVVIERRRVEERDDP